MKVVQSLHYNEGRPSATRRIHHVVVFTSADRYECMERGISMIGARFGIASLQLEARRIKNQWAKNRNSLTIEGVRQASPTIHFLSRTTYATTKYYAVLCNIPLV